MKISFDIMRDTMKQREQEIDTLRGQIPGLLILDSKLRVVLDEGKKSEAEELMEKINSLKQSNDKDKQFIAHSMAILKKNGLAGDEVNFDQMVHDENQKLQIQIAEAKNKFLNGEFDGSTYDALVLKLREPIESRIGELKAIESELSAYRKNQ